jgi:predicted Zn-dependent peptidase
MVEELGMVMVMYKFRTAVIPVVGGQMVVGIGSVQESAEQLG